MKTTTLSTRRRFFWKAGAALSAPLAATGIASGQEHDVRIARLEDESAIRALHQAYAARLTAGARDEAAELFADPAPVAPEPAVRALSADGFGELDAIEIAADGRSATARFHCRAEIETRLEPDCTLVQMAHAQGEGVLRRSERGVLEGAYVKRGGVWKIERLRYVPA